MRKPPVAYWLWMLVLLKLVTPAIVQLPLKLTLPEVAPSTPVRFHEESPASAEPVFSAAEAADRGPIIPAVEIPLEVDTPEADIDETIVPSASVADSAETGIFPEAEVSTMTASILPLESRKNTSGRSARLSWKFYFIALWSTGSVLWFALMVFRILRFERLIKRAQPASDWLQGQARHLAGQFSLRQCPNVLLVNGRVPPLLWSASRPAVVLLPTKLLDNLEPREQTMLLAHELAHFRRRDHWFRWVELLILGLYWWHPVAWWARRELQKSEEQCCDAWVLWAFPEQAKCYAQTLLNTVEFLSASRTVLPTAASGFGKVNEVKRRLEMILQNKMSRQSSWLVRIGLVLFGCVVLGTSARMIQADLPRAVVADADVAGRTENDQGVVEKKAHNRAAAELDIPTDSLSRVGALKKELLSIVVF